MEICEYTRIRFYKKMEFVSIQNPEKGFLRFKRSVERLMAMS